MSLAAAATYLVGVIKTNIVARKLVDTGNLLGSVTADVPVIGATQSYVEFGPHTVYAAIHEFGGLIRPVNKKALVFMGKDHKLVFTKVVHMPARPYLRPALDEHGKDAFDTMANTIGGIISEEWSK
jgi:phage gpG-like protein